jgi:hypothetical protein
VEHTEGEILAAAIQHSLVPRALFPEKPKLLDNDGVDKIRKYAGVWVSGAAKGSSFAFGKEAESYVDFGIPLMFVPLFLYGLLMGFAYKRLFRAILISDLRLVLLVVVFWVPLTFYAVSWAKTLGDSLMRIIVVGGVLTWISYRWELSLNTRTEGIAERIRRRNRPGLPGDRPA